MTDDNRLTPEESWMASQILVGPELRDPAAGLRRASLTWDSWVRLYEDQHEAGLRRDAADIEHRIEEAERQRAAVPIHDTRIMHEGQTQEEFEAEYVERTYKRRNQEEIHRALTVEIQFQRQRLNLLYALINRITRHGDTQKPDLLERYSGMEADGPAEYNETSKAWMRAALKAARDPHDIRTESDWCKRTLHHYEGPAETQQAVLQALKFRLGLIRENESADDFDEYFPRIVDKLELLESEGTLD